VEPSGFWIPGAASTTRSAARLCPRKSATFAPGAHQAAALVSYLTPGLRFFHQGQLEGRRKRISPHLVRAPDEPLDQELARFYAALLAALRDPAVRDGDWRLLELAPAWDGNWTSDCFVAWAWQGGSETRIAAVNYADHQSQCYVRLDSLGIPEGLIRLSDRLSEARYERGGRELATRGLYLDLPPFGHHLFALARV